MIDSPQSISEAIPVFEDWFWVVAYSGISLSTSSMRQLLPNEFSKTTTIDFARNLSGFVHACYKRDDGLAISLLKDVLAEPYRAPKIPNFLTAKAELEQLGMAATGISGSGPTLFSVTNNLVMAEKAKAFLQAHYIQNDLGFAHICKIDNQGARQV